MQCRIINHSKIIRIITICRALEENLKVYDVDRVLKAVCFLEILVKNCEIDFHRILFTHKFCNLLLKLLENQRNKKYSLLKVLIGRDRVKRRVEEKLLFLI